MLLGILKKSKDYFIGKTLGGELIKVNNFELEEEEGQVIELDLTGADYENVEEGALNE